MFLHFQKTFPARWMEWILAAILFSWGLMLARPEATFATSPSYLGLAQIGDEATWAGFCIAMGGIRLLALVINGMWVPPTYHLRSVSSFLSCFFWCQISLGIMASGLASTGLAVYPWLLVAEMICTYRAARDFRMSQAASEG